jgi:hypothetical protein
MSEFFKQYVCPQDERYSLLIEDDGRVSYAYLLEGRDIIADVWLYNQQEAPNNANWSDQNEMPFLNPKYYILGGKSVLPIENDSDVILNWKYRKELKEVDVFIRGERIAILKPNLRPSYSLLVDKDGPLAKKMELSNLDKSTGNTPGTVMRVHQGVTVITDNTGSRVITVY